MIPRTKEERREIYWSMYTTAVGLSMMTREELSQEGRDDDFPQGYCKLLRLTCDLYSSVFVPELWAQHPNPLGHWCEPYDWNTRLKPLLIAIEKTYEEETNPIDLIPPWLGEPTVVYMSPSYITAYEEEK